MMLLKIILAIREKELSIDYVTTPEQMEFESNNYQEIVFKANWTADCFTYAGTTITGFTDKGKAYLEYTKEVVLPDKNPSGEWITAIGAGLSRDMD